MVSYSKAGLETPVQRDWKRDVDPLRDLGDLAKRLSKHLAHGFVGAELSKSCARDSGHGVEGCVAEQLQPDLVTQLALDRRLEATRLEDCGNLATAIAVASVRLAEREPRSFDVPNHAGPDDLGRAVDDAPDYSFRRDRSRNDAAGVNRL